jgi:glycosyltransferase involved in cell wall biosynthesis
VRLARFLARDVAPEIVNLPNSLLIALAPAIRSELDVPICCTLQGEELFIDGLGEPYRSEAKRLIRKHAASVDRFVAVSAFGARQMSGYLGVAPEKISVVPLGIRCEDFVAPAAQEPELFTVGYLARAAPEKGLHVLCEAYRCLRARPGLPPSRLWAAGYLGPENKGYLDGILRRLDEWGLSGDFLYHGELDMAGKQSFLHGISVFSVPEPYADPKGLFLLEAMASGIPVVQPSRGASTELLETAGGGVLVEPDDPEALARGIHDLWMDPPRRRRLAARGREGVCRHYSAARMADEALKVYESVLRSKGSAAADEAAGERCARSS